MPMKVPQKHDLKKKKKMSEVPILSNLILSLEIANSTVSLEIVTEEKSIDWDIRNLSSLG